MTLPTYTSYTDLPINAGEHVAIIRGNGLRPALIDSISPRGCVLVRLVRSRFHGDFWDMPLRVPPDSIAFHYTAREVAALELPNAPISEAAQ